MRTRERKLISKRQSISGLVLIILGVLVMVVGLFGWLTGDMQLAALAPLTDQVYAARETAANAGTGVTGAFDLTGEDSGVRVFYAEYAAGTETGYINAQEFKIEENKKSLKGEGLQFPGTKDYPNLVIAEDGTVKLDNGMEFTQSVKLRGAGSSKYRSLKVTVDGPGTLTVWAMSSMADQERRMVLYNTKNGAELDEAMAPATVNGDLSALTFAIPEAGTFYLSTKGDVPIAPLSAIMNVAVVLLLIGVMAAYGFSKGQFKGREFLFMLVLGALMVPIQVTFVPIYVFIARLNMIDTYLGIILPNLVSAYFVFMLRQNFMAVDNSYIEAGKVDGMGRFGTIFHVLCPMCKPTLITVSIISFINGWNSYFWPKMISKSDASRTIAVGVQQLKNTFAGMEVSNYNEIMAGAVMAIVPIIALFLILQKYIMTGMSKAAMK